MVGNVYGRAIMDFMIGDNVVAGCKNVFEKNAQEVNGCGIRIGRIYCHFKGDLMMKWKLMCPYSKVADFAHLADLVQ